MRESQTDSSTILRWILVLPMFVLTFLFLRSVVRLVAFRLIIEPLTHNKLQFEFVLSHLYDQIFCVVLSVYTACVLAPKRRVTISILFFALVMATTPRQLELARENNYFGDLPWKTPFLIAAFMIGGLIPVMIMAIHSYMEKRKAQQIPTNTPL